MATITGFVRANIKATQAAPTGYSGGDVAEVTIDDAITSGTGANQADLLYTGATSVTGSSSVDVDLRALTSSAGAALTSLTEIVLFVLQWPSTATGSLTITPSGSNGLGALGSSIIVPPGGKAIFYCPPAAAYPVDSTHKSLNLANAGATISATITLLGRSA